MTALPHLREFVLEAEAPVRRNRQAERALREEVLWRLRGKPIMVRVAPDIREFGRTTAEKNLIFRIIAALKGDGAMVPGQADLAFLWAGGCGVIELKTPAYSDAAGYHRAGEPSGEQKTYAAWCHEIGVPHAYCRSAGAVVAKLREWGAPV